MKRSVLAVLIVLCLLLAGCGNYAIQMPEVTPTSTSVSEPTPTPEPETISGYARINNAEAFFEILDLGQEINIIGEKGDYYAAELEGVNILVEKRFVRLESEPEYEAKKAYSNGKCELYPDIYMQEEVVDTLGSNKEVTVLAEMGNTVLLEYEGNKYYADLQTLMESPIYYDYSSGGGGDSAPAPSGGQDGGDIELRFAHATQGFVKLAATEDKELKGLPAQKGYVLGDKVESYLWIYGVKEEVKISQIGEDSCEVFVNGNLGTIKSWMVELPDRAPYEKWHGYAVNSPRFFESYRLLGEGEKLSTNTELNVHFEFSSLYIVELEDGRIGFISKDSVSENPYVYVDYGGGGDSAGGTEWTEPVL